MNAKKNLIIGVKKHSRSFIREIRRVFKEDAKAIVKDRTEKPIETTLIS
jgi:hypothetical protein